MDIERSSLSKLNPQIKERVERALQVTPETDMGLEYLNNILDVVSKARHFHREQKCFFFKSDRTPYTADDIAQIKLKALQQIHENLSSLLTYTEWAKESVEGLNSSAQQNGRNLGTTTMEYVITQKAKPIVTSVDALVLELKLEDRENPVDINLERIIELTRDIFVLMSGPSKADQIRSSFEPREPRD